MEVSFSTVMQCECSLRPIWKLAQLFSVARIMQNPVARQDALIRVYTCVCGVLIMFIIQLSCYR